MTEEESKKIDEEAEEQSVDSSREKELQRILTPMNPKFKWYIVSTYSGSEETVKHQLLERIVKLGLEEDFGEIFIPKTTV